jgi:hypothetical protein
MLSTLSAENRILTTLAALGCSELAFSRLVAGIVGRTTIVKAFRDSSAPFTYSVADRLSERVGQMEELAKVIAPIPVDWTRTDQVSNALLIRMTARAALDLGLDEPELQAASNWATARIAESEAGGGEHG